MTEEVGFYPQQVDEIYIYPKEFLNWVYCPVKLPGSPAVDIPPNLEQFRQIIWSSITNFRAAYMEGDSVFNRKESFDEDYYVYITAKNLIVTPDSPGNRPGWHLDGFMTEDKNYIWCDGNPTEFMTFPYDNVTVTSHHDYSLTELVTLERHPGSIIWQGEPFVLYCLDPTVIHRVQSPPRVMRRCFVKVSISKNRYALEGNSVNHSLAPDWTYESRDLNKRACPSTGTV